MVPVEAMDARGWFALAVAAALVVGVLVHYALLLRDEILRRRAYRELERRPLRWKSIYQHRQPQTDEERREMHRINNMILDGAGPRKEGEEITPEMFEAVEEMHRKEEGND